MSIVALVRAGSQCRRVAEVAEVDAMCEEARRFLDSPDCQIRGALSEGRPELTFAWQREGLL